MNVKKIARAAIVGALYAALTLAAAPISFGLVQFRISEALCVLPWIIPEATWGLFVGCLLSNVIGGYGMIDIVFGSLATLIAGLVTARMKKKWLACLPPVISNAIIVGAVLSVAIGVSYPVSAAYVCLGEAVVLYVLGLPLLILLTKTGIADKIKS
ncbi:MAG: QueT transporter family protein [Oscillospiraceae bacterium]|nr:QueT transporter family protein [Oscillospiraceae bacterium]